MTDDTLDPRDDAELHDAQSQTQFAESGTDEGKTSPPPMRKFGLTRASNAKEKRWTDRRELTLIEASTLLLSHVESDKKDGPCFMPATLKPNVYDRKLPNVARVDFLVFDIDGVQSIEEATALVEKTGCYALIYSSYNHLTTSSTKKADAFMQWANRKKLPNTPTQATMVEFLADNDGSNYKNIDFNYDPEDREKRKRYYGEGYEYIFYHDPIHKFRVVFPLRTPIVINTLSDAQSVALSKYKAIYHGVGSALGLHYDHSCEDATRLFYFPSKPVGSDKEFAAAINGPGFEAEGRGFKFVDGVEIKFLDYTDYTPISKETLKGKSSSANAGPKPPLTVTDCEGVRIDIRKFERENPDFDIENCLRQGLPDEYQLTDRAKGGFHIKCPYEANHTVHSTLGTFVANSDGDNPWVVHCEHNSCRKVAQRKRTDYLAEIIRQGYVTARDLGVKGSASAEPSRDAIKAAIEELGQNASWEDIAPILDQVVAVNCVMFTDDCFNQLAKKTGKAKGPLKDAIKQAKSRRPDAARTEAEDDVPPTIEDACDKGEFLAVLVMCHEDYTDAKRSNFNAEDVEKAATGAGKAEAFKRDQTLVPLWFQTHEAIEDANHNERLRRDYTLKNDGTIQTFLPTKKEEPPRMVQVSSPLLIAGCGTDAEGRGSTLALKVKSESGDWVDLVLARSELTASGELVSKLKTAGVRTAEHEAMCNLLSVVQPSQLMTLHSSAGWNRDDTAFTLMTGEVLVAGAGATGKAPLATFKTNPAYSTGGTKEGADAMYKKVEDDAYIVTLIGNAMFAPLLQFSGVTEPGIVHLHGQSTTGKTTAACVAASVLGKGSVAKRDGIIQSWSSTAYAMEMKVGEMKDHPVFLDEAQLINSAEEFQRLAYSLANGQSKAAGMGFQGRRIEKTFRSPVISTGEASAKAIIENDRKQSQSGGAALRILDIHIERHPKDDEERHAAKRLADELNIEARTHYGHHFRILVQYLLEDRDAALSRIKHFAASALPMETEAECMRVRDRLSFVAGVIEYCIEKGMFPWSPGAGKRAVATVFETWKAGRGGEHSYAVNEALKLFKEALFRHPDRIHYLTTKQDAPRNRLAVWYADAFWFTRDTLVQTLGLDPKLLDPFLNYLASGKCADFGLRCTHGKQAETPKGMGLPKRMYCITDLRDLKDRGQPEADQQMGKRPSAAVRDADASKAATDTDQEITGEFGAVLRMCREATDLERVGNRKPPNAATPLKISFKKIKWGKPGSTTH